MTRSTVVFLFNLVQDVSVLRPIAMMVRREFDFDIVFLISDLFLNRDKQKVWQLELAQLRADLRATAYIYRTPADAFALLQNRGGVIIAGSESNLSAHVETHDVFRVAPPSFLTVTLQHGFECVGFLQNREHNLAHGRNVTFAANVICGWCEAPTLTSLAISERPKLYVTGPSTVLNTAVPGTDLPPVHSGIVCENLHSVRMRVSGDFGAPFMQTFREFCDAFGRYDQQVALRPHPAGQYVVNNAHDLASNVVINKVPIYAAGLHRYRFGISAPSSVVIDMLLAGIPTAVWHDAGGIMDYGNYAGLTDISKLEDWLAFARDAVMRPDALLARQTRFLDGLSMPREPADVYARFARLLATRDDGPAIRVSAGMQAASDRHICFLADHAESLRQSDLFRLLARSATCTVLCEDDMVPGARPQRPSLGLLRRMERIILDSKTNILIVTDYTGPHMAAIRDIATKLRIPLIVAIESDPFASADLDQGGKGDDMQHTERSLGMADLVYCADPHIIRSLRRRGFSCVVASEDGQRPDQDPQAGTDVLSQPTGIEKALALAETIVAERNDEQGWMPHGSLFHWVEKTPGTVAGTVGEYEGRAHDG